MPENLSKFKVKEERGDFYNSEIAELEQPIKTVLKEMLELVERGKYDLIIGIDSSGRIPALIVKKFIDYVYSKKGIGLSNIRFLAGNVSRENVEKQVQTWNLQKRVLIIEDTIATGDSIKFLCQALREYGIFFDVATVGTLGVYSDTSEVQEEIKEKLGVENIFFGIVGEPHIYSTRHLSGVIKEGSGETFSRPYTKSDDEYGDDSLLDIGESKKQARADVGIVAQHLISWYESQKQEQG